MNTKQNSSTSNNNVKEKSPSSEIDNAEPSTEDNIKDNTNNDIIEKDKKDNSSNSNDDVNIRDSKTKNISSSQEQDNNFLKQDNSLNQDKQNKLFNFLFGTKDNSSVSFDSNSEIIVAIDTMGGDNHPDAMIEGAVLSTTTIPNIHFNFFGDEKLISNKIKSKKELRSISNIIHTEHFIKSTDRPSQILRSSLQTSIGMGVKSVKNKKSHIFISAGNTGALMAISKMILGTLEEIDRPCISCFMPRNNNKTGLTLDVGANLNAGADNLVQFAIMGSCYAELVFGIKNPTVGLLNVGTEDMKGNDIVQLAHSLLEKETNLNYIGFTEGNSTVVSNIDVIITDGFTGNITLKALEGCSQLMKNIIFESFNTNLLSKISYLLVKKHLQKNLVKANPKKYNGAMFLGLNGISIKSHGNADKYSFCSAIENAYLLHKKNINQRIKESLKSREQV